VSPTAFDDRVVTFDPNGLEMLSEKDCLQLLRSAAIGRLALSVRALPVVLPVTFVLLPDAILVCTGAETRFDQACDQAVVAFEVDGFDPATQTGWSVLVQGTATVLTAPAELHEATRVGLTPWGNPHADSFVKVGLDLVTGRRLGGWYWASGLPEPLR
jgi:uncharacterized protein